MTGLQGHDRKIAHKVAGDDRKVAGDDRKVAGLDRKVFVVASACFRKKSS